MKKILITLSLVAFAFLAEAQVKTVAIQTSAVCEMCKKTLERDLSFEKGVKTVNLDLETMVLNVAYLDAKTDPETLRKRVTLVGYHADSLKRDPKAYEKLDPCCKDGAHPEADHKAQPKKKGDGK